MLFLRKFAAACLMLVGCVAIAQESGTPSAETSESSEDPYFALRRSKDRMRQLTAERYLNLVKLQDWTDSTGKFHTTARYVDHDPELKWVKLEAASGRGKDRVVHQKQIPFDRLSKQCQSRVRQISRLKPKMDELVLAEAKAQEDEDKGEGGRRDELEESPEGDDVEARDARRGYRSEIENELDQEVVGDSSRELTRESGREEIAMRPESFGRSALEPGESPVDRTQWRENPLAFQQNITLVPGPDGAPEVDWGELHEVRALSEALKSISAPASVGRESSGGSQRVADTAAEVGEITWEAPFMGLSTGLLGSKPSFAVPPLAPPVSLQFVLADPDHREDWSKLQPGQLVRFHGQLKMTGPYAIVVWVRMSDETAAEVAAQSPDTPSESRSPVERPNGRPGDAFIPTDDNPR